MHIWKLDRKEKGEMALMVIEVDQMIDDALINELEVIAECNASFNIGKLRE